MKTVDLTKYPYRIELHAHTSPVSPCSDMKPRELVRVYREAGADALVITNHFFRALFPDGMSRDRVIEYYLADYRAAREEGERLGLRVLLGAELRFPENDNDYLLYGISESEIGRIYDLLSEDLPHLSDAIAGEDLVLAQAHPFRNRMVRADIAYLDGIEVFNVHPGHNSRISLAAVHASEHGKLVLGGSDYHRTADFAMDGRAGMCFLRAPYLPETSQALAALLRSRDYLYEIGGALVFPYAL